MRFLRSSICFLFLVISVQALTFDQFITINAKQKEGLDQLKSRVSDKLPLDYMKEDIYLLTFLRDSEFDVEVAENKLSKLVEWRNEIGMDKVMNEDFSEYEEEYRAYWEGCDKEGNPVIAITVGDWDFRKEVIAGKRKKFTRFIYRLLEEGMGYVRWFQKEGFNLTQFSVICDLKGIAPRTHFCASCIPMYLDLVSFSQQFYLGFLNKVHIFNTPNFVLPLWDTFKSFYSGSLINRMEFHGTQKAMAVRELQESIHPSELSRKYGGLKEEGQDFFQLRKAVPTQFLINPHKIDLRGKNVTNICDLDISRIEEIVRQSLSEDRK